MGIVAAGALAGIGVVLFKVRRDFDRNLEASLREQSAADEIIAAVYGQLIAAHRQLQNPTAVNSARFDSLGQVAYTGLRAYLFLPMALEARMQVEAIRELHGSLEVEAHRAFDLVERGEPASAGVHIERTEAKTVQLEAAMDELVRLRARERAAFQDRQWTLARRWAFGIATVVIALVTFAFLYLRTIARRVMYPLQQLSGAAVSIGAGDLSARVPAQRDAELEVVADSFNHMAERIREADLERDRTQARFRRLFEEAPVALYRTSPEGKLLDANPAFAALLGYADAADVVGADVRAWYVRTEDRTKFDEAIQRDGVVRDQLIELRRADGTPIWVLDATTRLRDFNTGEVYNEGGLLDLTERVRMDAALRESDDRFREMAEHINEAFVIVDVQSGDPLYVSPMWSTIWGRPVADAYDHNAWTSGMSADDRAHFATAREKATRGAANELVFRVLRPDKSIRWVRTRFFPVRNAAGAVYRFVAVSEDITDLRHAEERFAQAQKMEAVGRLAGGVAHDFNNLLTVIIAETEMAQSALGPDHPQREGLAELRKASDSAVLLTQQLLAFSRKQLVEQVVFSVNDAVADTGKMLRRLIGEDIRLEIRLASDCGSVRADRGQIQQVLTNLAVNARDAMPEGGLLSIETASTVVDAAMAASVSDLQPGPYVVLNVSDTGCGMSDDVVAKAFEPFFTTKEKGKGTGLGLATSHGIVRQAGGTIAVYSQVGVGTTFRIYLPRVDDAATVVPVAANGDVPRGSETVLLVEDEPSVRRVGVRMLRALGYDVIEARNGADALQRLDTHAGTIHLLFTDVVMPEMGGRELTERALQKRPGIKVLFTSGYTDDVILQHRLAAHDVMVLQKPYSRASLAEKIRAALDA
jgi:two-component system cell cycle sensor histidine kinase/response regulator CckA